MPCHAQHSCSLALDLVDAVWWRVMSCQSTSSGRRIAAKIIKRYPTVDLGEEILMLMSRG